MAHSTDWPDDYKRGLVVVAHADDAEYGCSEQWQGWWQKVGIWHMYFALMVVKVVVSQV